MREVKKGSPGQWPGDFVKRNRKTIYIAGAVAALAVRKFFPAKTANVFHTKPPCVLSPPGYFCYCNGFIKLLQVSFSAMWVSFSAMVCEALDGLIRGLYSWMYLRMGALAAGWQGYA